MAAKKTRGNQRTGSTDKLPKPKWMQVSKLRPSRNARTHTEAQVALIAASIEEHGWMNPPLVDEKGFILAGHGRWQAAKLLKLKRIPVLPFEHLTAKQKRAYVLADNRLAELAGWDPRILAKELGELGDLGVDLNVIGFDPEAVQTAIAAAARWNRTKTEPDDVPEVEEFVVTREGDVWLLGKHRITCGDSTKPEDVGRVLAGAEPKICVTDPPYGVEYLAEWRWVSGLNRETGGGRRKAVAGDDRADWGDAWKLTPSDLIYAWTAAGDLSIPAGLALMEAGYEIRSQIIWRKPNFPLSRGHYTYRHEPCWYAVRKGGKAHWKGPKNASSVWDVAHDKGVEGGHSTQKPVELFRMALGNHRGDLYEPFLGTGTGLIAAEMTGRTCYGLELVPDFVDVVVRRWQSFAEGEAVIEGSGRTFAQIAKEREDGA